MNYLAHLYLSPNDPLIRVGNLMGDFVKGRRVASFPQQVQQGIYLHRKIDKFTDQHPAVKRLKSSLSDDRKRFSGIITDIVFDHLLAKHWLNFASQSLREFSRLRYKELDTLHAIMPVAMQEMTIRMQRGNWLEAYQDITSVAGAINGVSRRIRFENKLHGAAEEVVPLIGSYQQAFFEFFPELMGFVEQEIEALAQPSNHR